MANSYIWPPTAFALLVDKAPTLIQELAQVFHLVINFVLLQNTFKVQIYGGP